MAYLRYSPDLEAPTADEAGVFQKIADTFSDMGRQVAEQEGRAVRVSHAKTTALLEGELVVEDGLPPELAQGLASGRVKYSAIVRFAQGPGELLHDRISTHRGMAVKLTGLKGDSIPESDEPGIQDFAFEAHSRAFINSNATRFLAALRLGVSHAPSMSEEVKNAVSKVAHAMDEALDTVGRESKTLGFFGHPPLHPLADAYFSQVPMRWGDYVGKLGFFPSRQTLHCLAELKVDNREDHDAFRSAMVEHFAAAGAEFELRVQLATSLDETPIEDASREWPEENNPYQTVARLTLPIQRAWSPEREARSESLSFRPANSLMAHRPLGQIMRARLFVYRKLAELRHRLNGDAPAHATGGG